MPGGHFVKRCPPKSLPKQPPGRITDASSMQVSLAYNARAAGFEAASAIRALEREDAQAVPIIAISADAFRDDVQKCLACGMDAHTANPWTRTRSSTC